MLKFDSTLGDYSNNPFATSATAVTPADGADLAKPCVGLWVGGAGNVKVDMLDGTTVTFSGVPAGTWLRICAKRVYATGTTATLILSLR